MAGTVLSQGQVHICAAVAALSQGTVQISRQAQHFRRYRFHGRRNTFPRSGTKFVEGAALSHRGRRSTCARCDYFAAGAALSQGGSPPDARRCDDSARGALISVNILQTSRGVGGGGSPPHDVRRSDASTKGDDDRRMFEEAMLQQRGMVIEEAMIQQRAR